MPGCEDDNPDDERREAARDYTKSVSRGADGSRGISALPHQYSTSKARRFFSTAFHGLSSIVFQPVLLALSKQSNSSLPIAAAANNLAVIGVLNHIDKTLLNETMI
jgi:hypothetical protein